MNQQMNDIDALLADLITYGNQWPAESETVNRFRQLLELDDGPDPFSRERLEGHFTGSAWVVSADRQRAALLHHRKLDRWLQPGGHADGERDLAAVALREAEEETGLRGLRVEPDVFDLDRHRIPARGVEPEHWHYDMRFIVNASGDETFVVNEESHALAWRPIAGIAQDPAIDASVRRLATKFLNGAGSV